MGCVLGSCWKNSASSDDGTSVHTTTPVAQLIRPSAHVDDVGQLHHTTSHNALPTAAAVSSPNIARLPRPPRDAPAPHYISDIVSTGGSSSDWTHRSQRSPPQTAFIARPSNPLLPRAQSTGSFLDESQQLPVTAFLSGATQPSGRDADHVHATLQPSSFLSEVTVPESPIMTRRLGDGLPKQGGMLTVETNPLSGPVLPLLPHSTTVSTCSTPVEGPHLPSLGSGRPMSHPRRASQQPSQFDLRTNPIWTGTATDGGHSPASALTLMDGRGGSPMASAVFVMPTLGDQRAHAPPVAAQTSDWVNSSAFHGAGDSNSSAGDSHHRHGSNVTPPGSEPIKDSARNVHDNLRSPLTQQQQQQQQQQGVPIAATPSPTMRSATPPTANTTPASLRPRPPPTARRTNALREVPYVGSSGVGFSHPQSRGTLSGSTLTATIATSSLSQGSKPHTLGSGSSYASLPPFFDSAASGGVGSKFPPSSAGGGHLQPSGGSLRPVGFLRSNGGGTVGSQLSDSRQSLVASGGPPDAPHPHRPPSTMSSPWALPEAYSPMQLVHLRQNNNNSSDMSIVSGHPTHHTSSVRTRSLSPASQMVA